MSGLQKRFDKVGFIKPVGQVCLTVKDDDGQDVEVDKDVVVVRSHFQLNHCSFRHMSPVRIPPGYTRDYIDGIISRESQKEDVLEAFHHIDNASDVVLCEGTGHCGVGSIVGASNARVASWVGGKMVSFCFVLCCFVVSYYYLASILWFLLCCFLFDCRFKFSLYLFCVVFWHRFSSPTVDWDRPLMNSSSTAFYASIMMSKLPASL